MLERLGTISPLWQRIILVLGCVVLYCLWFTHVPLFETDEVRYVEATREMFESRNFLIPHYNYEPRYEKPIFYYWVQGASRAVFGPSEWAARLPSGILGILLVLLLHAFLLRRLRAWAGEDAERQRLAGGSAFLGAIAMATVPLVAVWTRAAITDITLTLFMTGALLALLQAEMEPHAARWWYLLAAAACGFAFLTKGPIGLAIPGATWLVYQLYQRSLWREVRRVPWVMASFIFLAISVPWYVATYFAVGIDFLKQFFFTENVARYTGETAHKAITFREYLGNTLAYFAQIPLITFPFSAFCAHEAFVPFANNTSLRQDEQLVRLRRFAGIWALVVIVVFALSKTQFINYIQSAAAGVIILFTLHMLGRLPQGAQIQRDARQRRGVIIERVFLWFFGIAWIGGMAYILLRGEAHRRQWDMPFPHVAAMVSLGLVLVFGILLLAGYVRWNRSQQRQGLPLMFAAWTGFVGVLIMSVAPMFFASSFAPEVPVGNYLRTLPKQEQVITYLPRHPENFVYYGQRHVEFYNSKRSESADMVRGQLAKERTLIVVTNKEYLDTVASLGQMEPLKQIGYFTIARLRR